jgi:hypothetical protein
MFIFFKTLLLLIVFSTAVYSQKNQTPLPKSYIAQHTSEPIKIDGEAKESSWNKVLWSDDFMDIEGIDTPKFRTRLKMMYDDTNLYFYAELEDPHVWATLKKRDTVIFHNKDFEIFIDPDGDTHPYYEYEINALNTVWDLMITKPYRDGGKVFTNWDFKNAKSAIHINGTLNNPSDIDKMWSVEIAIPWKAIYETYDDRSHVPQGKTWRINFSRVHYDHDIVANRYHKKRDEKTGKQLHEYNWVWTPQGVINLHEPEKWGYVYFSKKSVGEKDEFIYSKDEVIKQKLYEIHRSLKGYLKKGSEWKNLEIPKKIVIDKNEITLNTEVHSKGYNISLISPFTEKTMSISEDGRLTRR